MDIKIFWKKGYWFIQKKIAVRCIKVDKNKSTPSSSVNLNETSYNKDLDENPLYFCFKASKFKGETNKSTPISRVNLNEIYVSTKNEIFVLKNNNIEIDDHLSIEVEKINDTFKSKISIIASKLKVNTNKSTHSSNVNLNETSYKEAKRREDVDTAKCILNRHFFDLDHENKSSFDLFFKAIQELDKEGLEVLNNDMLDMQKKELDFVDDNIFFHKLKYKREFDKKPC